jgi:CMP-N-acetylneuraminic acid synthetase
MARVLAIVPARGGSKRVPRKNVQTLAGKPLVVHTLLAAVDSGCFARVVLSSDDPGILAIGASVAGVTAEARAVALAGDTVKVVDLILSYAGREDVARDFDAIALMLPTCPFRRARHVREGMALLTPEVDGVISVTNYEFPPQLGVTLETGDIMKGFVDPSPLLTGNTRSQDQAPVFRPNGALYGAWLESFRRERSFFKGRVRGYRMGRLESVDIDDATDLDYARYLADKGLVDLT